MNQKVLYIDVFYQIEKLIIVVLQNEFREESVNFINFAEKSVMNRVQLLPGISHFAGMLSVTIINSNSSKQIMCLIYGRNDIGLCEVEDHEVGTLLLNSGSHVLELDGEVFQKKRVKCLGIATNGGIFTVACTKNGISGIILK